MPHSNILGNTTMKNIETQYTIEVTPDMLPGDSGIHESFPVTAYLMQESYRIRIEKLETVIRDLIVDPSLRRIKTDGVKVTIMLASAKHVFKPVSNSLPKVPEDSLIGSDLESTISFLKNVKDVLHSITTLSTKKDNTWSHREKADTKSTNYVYVSGKHVAKRISDLTTSDDFVYIVSEDNRITVCMTECKQHFSAMDVKLPLATNIDKIHEAIRLLSEAQYVTNELERTGGGVIQPPKKP